MFAFAIASLARKHRVRFAPKDDTFFSDIPISLLYGLCRDGVTAILSPSLADRLKDNTRDRFIIHTGRSSSITTSQSLPQILDCCSTYFPNCFLTCAITRFSRAVAFFADCFFSSIGSFSNNYVSFKKKCLITLSPVGPLVNF